MIKFTIGVTPDGWNLMSSTHCSEWEENGMPVALFPLLATLIGGKK